MISDTAPHRPYKGPHSFADTPEDRLLFFGRGDEARALLDLVVAERFSLLYGRSGLGKTSLLNARLMEPLRDGGYFPVEVRVTRGRESNPLSALYLSVESEGERQGVQITASRRDSLWHYFSFAHFTKNGRPQHPVLVLDQFEELFTHIREESPERFETFVSQLADLVQGRLPENARASTLRRIEELPEDNPERRMLLAHLYGEAAPDVKVLLSFREDFLPEMEALQDRIPTIFRNVLRLKPLTRVQAKEAIKEPAQVKDVLGNDTFTYTADAVEEMLDFLGTQIKAGQMVAGQEIEPVQLQLLCDELDRRRRAKKNEEEAKVVTAQDLGGSRGMTRILERYYRNVLRRFPRFRLGWSARQWRFATTNLFLFHCPRQAIRKLCEIGLITSARRNTMMADEIKRRFGVNDSDLKTLVNERLVRSEPRLGSEFFELAHDSLVKPLVTARRRRMLTLALIFVPLLALPYASLVVEKISDRFERIQTQQARKADLDIIARAGVDPRDRDEALKRLITNETDLSGLELRLVNLTGVKVNVVNFSKSNLQGARFDRASFENVQFNDANLFGASFVGARLGKEVTFEGANLRGANLQGADLTETTFTNADLGEAVLAETELTRARMNDTKIDSADFRAAEWWFAEGWSEEQFRDLQKRWPYREIAKTERYRNQIRNLSLAVAKASGRERARALATLAWYRAKRGVDLDSASKEARDAIALLERSEPDPVTFIDAIDTVGYVLLQLKRDNDAIVEFSKVPDHLAKYRSRMTKDDQRLLSEWHYHFGVALSRVGKQVEAQKHFKEAADLGHTPTYELLLTPVGDTKSP